MKYNVEKLTSARRELESATNNLSSSMSSEWDDEVSASYESYISQCKGALSSIRSVEEKVVNYCKAMSAIDVNSLISKARETAEQLKKA